MKPSSDPTALSFGVITDLHYADKDMNINRFYRESTVKLRTAVATFNNLKPSFVIELGDLIDQADKEAETGYIKTIDGIYHTFKGKRYYILGNHDVATFSKGEFLKLIGEYRSFYSFTRGEYHFIVLDANFHRDGSPYNAGDFDWKETYIPPYEMEWLKKDLNQAGKAPCIVFIHQNLHDETNPHGVKNAPEVRKIIETAGTVRAVFQGHDHAGGFAKINGIPYLTFRAAVDGTGPKNNAFAMVSIMKDGTIQVKGYGKQESVEFKV
jgi:predicted phosphodiesterase